MVSLEVINQKLEDQSKKLDKIDETLVALAVQNAELKHLQMQVKAQWKILDSLTKPDGLLARIEKTNSDIQVFQKNCGYKDLQVQVKCIWATIVSMALGILFKYLTDTGGK